jgi:AcrR family transcriptional regulator
MSATYSSRDEVVERLLSVIRREGYDGASLAELSKATGLGKSSLYHYFPNGKDDMVAAVLDHLESVLRTALFAPLRAPGDPAARVRAMTRALDVFYAHGREACLLAALGIGESSRPFHARVHALFAAWIDAMAAPLRDAGLSPVVARRRAEAALVRIEGAVVVARAMQDPTIFRRALADLARDLLSPATT